MTNVRHKIRQVRDEKGYSQFYMGEKLGMTQPNYRKYESGENKMTVEMLERIAKILGKPAAWFLVETESADSLEQRIGKLEGLVEKILEMLKSALGRFLSGGGGDKP